MNQAAELTEFAEAKLKEHGLWEQGWRFEFCRAKTFLGFCKYRRKKIFVSYFYLSETPVEKLKDTILHEIAHALVGFAAGHGPVWQAACLRIGAKPNRCAPRGTAASSAIHRWHGKCTGCGQVVAKQHRAPRVRRYHRTCGPSTMITWTQVYSGNIDSIMAQKIAGV